MNANPPKFRRTTRAVFATSRVGLTLLLALISSVVWAVPPSQKKTTHKQPAASNATQHTTTTSPTPKKQTILAEEYALSHQPPLLSDDLRKQLDVIPGLTSRLFHPAFAGLILRGHRGAQLHISLEGIPLLHAMNNQRPDGLLQSIDPLFLQRVRLWRGPASIEFGNHGFGGGLALIARQAQGPKASQPWRMSASLRGQYSSADQSPGGHLALGFATPTATIRLTGAFRHHALLRIGGQDTTIPSSSYQRAHATAHATWTPGPFSLSALYLFGQVDNIQDNVLFRSQGDVWKRRERRHFALLKAEIPLHRTTLSFKAAYQLAQHWEDASDLALGTRDTLARRLRHKPLHRVEGIVDLHTRFAQATLQLQVTYSFQSMHTEQIAQQGDPSRLPSDSPLSGQRHALGLLLKSSMTLLQRPFQLRAFVSGRIQPHWDQTTLSDGSLTQPGQFWPYALRGGLHAQHTHWETMLFYHSGYRVPSWLESSLSGPQGPYTQQPNDALLPEHNHTFEWRLTLRIPKRLQWTTRLYAQLWQQLLVPSTPSASTQQITNRTDIVPFVGAESSFQVRIWHTWKAHASISWMQPTSDTKTLTSNELWPLFTPLMATVGTSIQFRPWGSIGVILQVADQQTTTTQPLRLRILLQNQQPTYPLWTNLQINAHLQITRHVQLQANFRNLFHQRILTAGSLHFEAGIDYRLQLILSY
jgi:outer membrane receptor protein involved in Fe transport